MTCSRRNAINRLPKAVIGPWAGLETAGIAFRRVLSGIGRLSASVLQMRMHMQCRAPALNRVIAGKRVASIASIASCNPRPQLNRDRCAVGFRDGARVTDRVRL